VSNGSISRQLGPLTDAVAAHTPTPGGGAVAPAVGALAAALGSMVVTYTEGKKKYAEHAALHASAAERLGEFRHGLLAAADRDARAYEALSGAMALDKDDPQRAGRVSAAAADAARVPAGVIAMCHELLQLLESLAGRTNRMLRSDLAIAAILAEACCRASAWNVRINLPLMSLGPDRDTLAILADSASGKARELSDRVEHACIR